MTATALDRTDRALHLDGHPSVVVVVGAGHAGIEAALAAALLGGRVALLTLRLDRIGGGDGFASGLIYGMLDGRELDEVVRLGWAHGALSTTFPGDVTMARLPEVEAFDEHVERGRAHAS